ncbi:hypothetical protein LMG26858_03629 [Achromobacter anxifer]|uniref:Uncharacterized protein n=1 Tax=Achromobacter anxifer TaxID=1287737 RepID=A0A6S7DKX3_9BURK|nr:hypothetical protein [Achromobacter anxifer]CAB3889030.1 hypothetical protein LMG26858_03629 [Achromobacter anxifer]CAB5513369.1 hypothetical protein LMG26857_02649 [Achromobacter anxifer]
MNDVILTEHKGFRLGVRAVPLRCLEQFGTLPEGFLPLVQVTYSTLVLVDWSIPSPLAPRDTPARAIRDGTAYLKLLIDSGKVNQYLPSP